MNRPRRQFHFSIKLLLIILLVGGPLAGLIGILVKQYLCKLAMLRKGRQLDIVVGGAGEDRRPLPLTPGAPFAISAETPE